MRPTRAETCLLLPTVMVLPAASGVNYPVEATQEGSGQGKRHLAGSRWLSAQAASARVGLGFSFTSGREGLDGKPDGQFGRPLGIAMDSSENVDVVDKDDCWVRAFNADDQFP